MKKNKTLKKCLITTIATTAISIVTLLTSSNTAFAYGTWQGNATSGMPSLSYSASGLFPQILKQRKFTGDADNQFPYEAWTTDMSTGTVYCNDAGKAVRFGEFDSEKHYIDEIGYTTGNGYGYSAFETKVRAYLRQLAREDVKIKVEDIWFHSHIATYIIHNNMDQGLKDRINGQLIKISQ